ncbi:MAG TPA: potassium channel family protein [Thermoanaerobaculia bacterium]
MTRAEVSIATLLAGALILVATLWDAFETMVLSRRVSRGNRLTVLFYRWTWPSWRALARRMPRGNKRENFLTVYGPLWLLLLIGLWALSMVLAFGLMQGGAGSRMASPDGSDSFMTTLYMSGTTLFTLGLGDVVPHSAAGRFVTVFESGIGLGFLALVIGYLPVVSQAFSRREASIALLDARAGSPPTAVELLRRHLGDGGEDALMELLRDWEHTSAELLESHVSFPVLAFYRSQHDNQSWVAAMTALLDACALILAVVDTECRRQAKLTFAMARHAVADLARVLNSPPPTAGPDRLSPAELARLREQLTAAHIPLRADTEAGAKLAELRGMYEPTVASLSALLLMPLPPWMPPAAARENWLSHL